MTPTLEEIAPHMARFLDMLDAAFRRKGVPDGLPERFRNAVVATPRHMFVHRFRISGGRLSDRIDEGALRDNDADPIGQLADIYSDAVMIHVDAAGERLPSTNSQPSYALWLLHLLDMRPGQRVLEIGSGSGWLAAVMARLVGKGGQATGMEIIPELAVQSRADLEKLGIDNVSVLAADGAQGDGAGAPFDRVMITAATWDLPTVLFDQVAEGGRVLVPVELRGDGCHVTILRREGERFVAERALPGWFVPLLGPGQRRPGLRVALAELPFWDEIGTFLPRRVPLPLAMGPDGAAGSAVCAFRAFLGRTAAGFDVATGESTLVQQNKGFFGHFTDQQLRVRFARRHTDDGDIEYLQRGTDGEWALFSRIGAEDAIPSRAIEFSADGRELYWLDSRGRNTAAVVAQDLKSGAMRVLAEDRRADFTQLVLDPISERPVAAARSIERVAWQVLEPDYQDDFDYLTRQSRGDLTITSMSQDRRHWIVAYQYDDAPLEYFHYDRAARQVKRLFSSMPAWEGLPFVPMEPVIICARDGLEFVPYLSRPRDPPPTAPLPMVLLVHGGPWARDVWGLYADHQWLANRGYAVLSLNYRGSTGFGKAFVNAANLEWAGKMHDDLIDAVDWAIAQQIADPARVAIVGTSYGGYSALVGLTFTPEKFACAADLCGISNLVTFLNTIPEYWLTWKSLWKVRTGDYTTEAGLRFLEERSPLNRADRIVRPLLIAQGANDVRVKASESGQIVAAMQQRGIPVTYVCYPDEGHGLGRPENRRSFKAVVEAFLAAHLGGRCEPVGDDFEGSTIEFKAGRELIPGLD